MSVDPVAAANGETGTLAALHGSDASFADVTEPYRRQLHVHCYRMLGSFDDAEDMVQETMLCAWRGRHSFEGRSLLRTWLYRIATNACLNALERAPRRMMPSDVVPPVTIATDSSQARETPPWRPELPWLQPYPDALLEPPVPSDTEPDTAEDRYPTLRPDLADRLAELVAAGCRGDAVELFQTEAVGIPPEVVAQLRHAPFRPGLEAIAHTLVYDATIEQIEPERLFAWRWHVLMDLDTALVPQPTTLDVFELEEVEDGTPLTVTESGFDSIQPEHRDAAYRGNESGWSQQMSAQWDTALGRLKQFVKEQEGVNAPCPRRHRRSRRFLPFSPRFAWLSDRYGVSWQLALPPSSDEAVG